jgi:cytochrome oxidase assembly protein ShyY1
VLWTMRQPRYSKLAALMVVLAAGCVLAGTWQLSRYHESVRDNDALRDNAHAPATALTAGLVPLVGHGAAPTRDAIRFRTVTITGSYLAVGPQFLGTTTSSGQPGFAVVAPVRTDDGIVLVSRGIVVATAAGTPPDVAAVSAARPVRLTGRLETAATSNDRAGSLPDAQIASINPAQQAARLRNPVYQAYVKLSAHQPGSVGVVTKPDLSNPAGGAYEAQHLAYIIQWYAFAVLALLAPFLISRSEVRDTRRKYLGIDPGEDEFGLAESDPTARLPLAAGSPSDVVDALAVRDAGEVARHDAAARHLVARAERLSDRYGRSLGPDGPGAAPLPRPGRRGRAYRPVPNSASQPHRSSDGYHGSYNDYLWQLALADGDLPEVAFGPRDEQGRIEPPKAEPSALEPRVIDQAPSEPPSDADVRPDSKS